MLGRVLRALPNCIVILNLFQDPFASMDPDIAPIHRRLVFMDAETSSA
jgi:hypothetical protein